LIVQIELFYASARKFNKFVLAPRRPQFALPPQLFSLSRLLTNINVINFFPVSSPVGWQFEIYKWINSRVPRKTAKSLTLFVASPETTISGLRFITPLVREIKNDRTP